MSVSYSEGSEFELETTPYLHNQSSLTFLTPGTKQYKKYTP